MDDEVRIAIEVDADIVAARQEGRAMAQRLGFVGSDLTIIATAISEVARNIIKFAKHGEIIIRPLNHAAVVGVVIIARDDGPGIADIGLAMQDGYSTGRGLGLGLPGCRRLVDEFAIESTVGMGTTVTMKKMIK